MLTNIEWLQLPKAVYKNECWFNDWFSWLSFEAYFEKPIK